MNKDLDLIFEGLKADDAIRALSAKERKGSISQISRIGYKVDRVKVASDPMPFILKHTAKNCGLGSMASSRMYQNAGILTPEQYFVESEKDNHVSLLQRDVTAIRDIETILAYDDADYAVLEHKLFGKYKWEILYNSEFRQAFLQFMTPECLDQLINIFLADEVRTDNDRHRKNYFFYKRKDFDKYEAVIAIDLENMKILGFNILNVDDFEGFLHSGYYSETPQMKLDNLCYKKRIENLREVIQDGVMTKSNIETLKTVLGYDFPKEVKQLAKSQKLKRRELKRIVEPVERLWDYNYETLGRDLGL